MWTLPELEAQLASDFGLKIEIENWVKEDKSIQSENVIEKVTSALVEKYVQKTEVHPQDAIRRLEREIMLQIVDRFWKEHLATMDHLRAGIYLRSYGGRNPKQEYKRESFELFSSLLERIRMEVIRLLSRVELASPEEIEQMRQKREEQERKSAEAMSLKHADASPLSEGTSGHKETTNEPTQAAKTPFVREQKIGRNDPCPCGSGKKYKQCCGKLS